MQMFLYLHVYTIVLEHTRRWRHCTALFTIIINVIGLLERYWLSCNPIITVRRSDKAITQPLNRSDSSIQLPLLPSLHSSEPKTTQKAFVDSLPNVLGASEVKIICFNGPPSHLKDWVSLSSIDFGISSQENNHAFHANGHLHAKYTCDHAKHQQNSTLNALSLSSYFYSSSYCILLRAIHTCQLKRDKIANQTVPCFLTHHSPGS